MFRFTIRDVLWLTLVAAIGVGWWLAQRSYEQTKVFDANTIQRLQNRINGLQNQINGGGNPAPIWLPHPPSRRDYQAPPARPMDTQTTLG